MPAMALSRPELSLVILCYKAEDFAVIFVERVKQALAPLGISYELVLVANYHRNQADTDRTPEIAAELAAADERITVVAKPKEGMMGWDMRSGLAAARGDTIAVIDGDGQMPPEDAVRVYQKLKSGRYDMAKTYRETRQDGLTRRVISLTYNAALKLLFPNVRVRDANSKPKIFTRAALDALSLTSDGWFIDAEIIIQASEQKFAIGEVPTVFYENPRRPSFIRFRSVVEFALNLIFYRLKTLWHRLRAALT